MIAGLLLSLAFLMLIGTPVAFAIGLSGVVALLIEGQIPLEVVPQRAFAALDSWALMAVPLFILAGDLMNACGLSRRGIALAERLRSGLPTVATIASIFFASISGSSSASTAAVGSIMIPAMVRKGYPTGFAAALQAAGGAIGPIIPPSIIMIVMGYVTGVSIAALFLGGVVPGVLIGGALIAGSYRAARRYERAAPDPTDGAPRSALSRALWDALPALLMPLVVLGGILGGIFTATEAAGIAVAYSLLIGFFVYRELHLEGLPRILLDSALRSCVVMFVAAGAYLFAWLIAVGRVPDEIGADLQAWATTPLTFLIATNVVLLVVGMFMESISAIIVIMPILFPIATALGIDPLHFCVVATVNLCIGMVTPPYGATLFVACSLTGLSVNQVAPWTVRPVAMMLIVLVLMMLVPGVVTLLPRLFGLV